MTFEQALQKAHVRYPNDVCLSALDMGDVWAFHFDDIDESKRGYGRGYVTINKTNGDVGQFSPVLDLEAFSKAKRINIK